MNRPPPPFTRYLRHALGTGTAWELFRRMLSRAFGAKTFADFWRYWNPLYGYFLRYYCFGPLRRRLPKSMSLCLTFAVSGFFLHDLLIWPMALALNGRPPFPVVTVAFGTIASVVLLTEHTKLSLSHLGPFARATSHSVLIIASFVFAVTLGIAT